MITKEAVEAARSAIRYLNGPDTPWSDEQVSAVLTAALAAIPAQEERQNYNCPCAHPSQCDSSCLTPARIMSAIEPAGVGVETPPPSTHSRGDAE